MVDREIARVHVIYKLPTQLHSTRLFTSATLHLLQSLAIEHQ
jgi:hypothetical protein